MNTTTGGGATASEGSEQQQFLAELRKLEDSARQFQSEVLSYKCSIHFIE